MTQPPDVLTDNAHYEQAFPDFISTHQFPEFPDCAYLGILADFADLVSHYYETPKEFLYFAAILQIGTALCGRVRADFGSLPTQPRLYGLKIAPVGTGKKSTADALAQKFVGRALSGAATTTEDEFWNTLGSASQWMFVLPGAGSGEGLLSAFAVNKRVFLTYDEFERFAKKASVEGSVLVTAVNELFENTNYANATKGNVLSLSGVYLGFSANMPLEQFESTSGVNKMLDLGLWSRLAFVVGDRRRRILRIVDPPEEQMKPLVETLASYFKQLPTKEHPQNKALIPEHEIRLPLTPEALKRWDEYETAIGFGPDTTRLDTIGMRMMAILAFTSGKQQIDGEVVGAVLGFLAYQKTVRELYKPSRAETVEARVEASILRCVKRADAAGSCPVSVRDLRRASSIEKTYGIEQLNNGLTRLCGAQVLQKFSQAGRKDRFGLGPEAD